MRYRIPARVKRIRRRAGFSLIEVMVAVMVLTVALFGTLASMGLSSQVRETSNETELATAILQKQVEEYRGETFGNLVASVYADNDFSDEIDDPIFTNQVISATVIVLNETQASAAFPSDVDKDGDIDAADVYDLDRSGTGGDDGVVFTLGNGAAEAAQQAYSIVPLRFTISWRNVRGGTTRTLTMDTFIYPQTSS